MKTPILALALLCVSVAQAQTKKTVTFQEYQNLKDNGQLKKNEHYAFVGNTNSNQLKQIQTGFKIEL